MTILHYSNQRKVEEQLRNEQERFLKKLLKYHTTTGANRDLFGEFQKVLKPFNEMIGELQDIKLRVRQA